MRPLSELSRHYVSSPTSMRPLLYPAARCALLGCGSAFRFKFVWHAMQICLQRAAAIGTAA
jgi:hypothetical protein